ncbi:MAG TPA: nucleotidyltransferase domain-containing protein, partial [Reyranella sp.]|nr:nucleotidyltransferase domain-containing protein [Reyranella sp.]
MLGKPTGSRPWRTATNSDLPSATEEKLYVRGMMVAASQQNLIDEIGKLLHEEARVEAVWLAGNLGRGEGDIFSDVDLLVLVEDGTLA